MFRVIFQHCIFQSVKVQFKTNAKLTICRLLCANRNNNADKNEPILQDKFIDFFRRNAKYRLYTVLNTDMNISSVFENGDTSVDKLTDNLPVNQIPSFLLSVNSERHHLSHCYFQLVASADKTCSKKLFCMDKNAVLRCLYSWYEVYKGNIIFTKMYSQFMHVANQWLNKQNNNLELLVCLTFYAGLSKKTHESQFIIKRCLREIDAHIQSLSLDELCIIISSSYKCSVKIKSTSLLQHICNVMNKNLETLFADPGYLVTFAKGLRFARHYNKYLMDNMANKLYTCDIMKMNLTAKIHLLALYAETLYDKDNFINLLIYSCIEDTSSSAVIVNNYANLRIKDISRFLWAASYLGYSPSHEDLRNITCELQKCVNERHHLQNPEHLVGSLLSLWIMGHFETLLFKSAISQEFLRRLREKRLFRSNSRLSLLLTCIQIEMPEILSNTHYQWTVSNRIPPDILEKHREKRSFLKQIFIATTNLSKHLKLHATFGCYITNLNILGITVSSFSGKVMHIEVLDETVCLHKTHLPHGLMKLKLRLLKNMGHHVLLVHDNQFDFEKDSNNLYIFLDEELMKLLKSDVGAVPR